MSYSAIQIDEWCSSQIYWRGGAVLDVLNICIFLLNVFVYVRNANRFYATICLLSYPCVDFFKTFAQAGEMSDDFYSEMNIAAAMACWRTEPGVRWIYITLPAGEITHLFAE